MKRRRFIKLSTAGAITLQSNLIFTGCSNNTKKTSNTNTIINADEAVLSISQLQNQNDTLHDDVTKLTNNLLQNDATSGLFTKFQNNSCNHSAPNPNRSVSFSI
ncbi:hypothetical protein [Sulfurimonas sp.]|uniref:hypothetical protein n=1 Tax=Sulfurimonas sp. TaxID=2022749 RepID=UPI00260F6CA1|nr:hypothetical protein [Sulfurimonas sp.]